jgi:hypothetical protein
MTNKNHWLGILLGTPVLVACILLFVLAVPVSPTVSGHPCSSPQL